MILLRNLFSGQLARNLFSFAFHCIFFFSTAKPVTLYNDETPPSLLPFIFSKSFLSSSFNPFSQFGLGAQNVFFIFFCLPYLSSIHEKANCIAIFWTVSPHLLGSCHFRVTCLSHKGGGVPFSALPKDTTSEPAGLFSTTSLKCRAQGSYRYHFLKSLGLTRQGE